MYRFSDQHGRVIYVGKAKSLRQRLNSYFADLSGLHPRTRQMVTTAARVEWTVVATEVEALQLEYNWIKEFDPRFNVRYRDDKTYPVLAVTMNEEFPRLHVYRGPRRKGVRYFGPYAHAWAIRETLDLLLRVFPARTCSAGVFKRHGQIGRPCLLGYIDKCSAPCVGRVDADEHREIVEDFCDFLSGRTDHLVRQLEREMADGVGEPGVRAGGPAARRHRGAAPRHGEAGRRARRRHRRRRRRVRRGRAGGRRPGLPRARRPGPRPARMGDRQGRAHRHGRSWSSASSPSSTASRRRWPAPPTTPSSPCPRRSSSRSCPAELDARSSTGSRACADRGCRCACRSAATSGRSPRPSTRNAAEAFTQHKLRRAGDLTARSAALQEIQDALGLDSAPLRIECIDVSHVQGSNVVASLVVFEDGLARKSDYRRFEVRGGAEGGRRRRDRRGRAPAVPAPPGRERQPAPEADRRRPRATPSRLGRGHRYRFPECHPDTPRHRPEDGSAAPVRLPAEPARGRRRSAAGRGRGRRAGRARGHRRRRVRAGQAPRGGLAARRARPGDPVAHQRGALPAAAGARRGAPIRHHLPPPASFEEHGRPPSWTRCPGWVPPAATALLKHFGSVRKLGPPTPTRSRRVPGFGPRTAAAVLAALHGPDRAGFAGPGGTARRSTRRPDGCGGAAS